LLSLKTSRISRLALFLSTARPSFLLAATPSRALDRPLCLTNRVRYRPRSRLPWE
jgi:hypothetical protein